jgi:hypothetical protein
MSQRQSQPAKYYLAPRHAHVLALIQDMALKLKGKEAEDDDLDEDEKEWPKK